MEAVRIYGTRLKRTNLKEDKSFVPDPKRAAYYRKIYERKTKLVREEMRAAFVALEEIRQVEK